MVNRFIYCLLFGLLFINSNAFAQTRILILGDSLSASYQMKQSEGWVHRLQQRFNSQNKPIKLINASISGETTAGGLARLDKILQSQNPHMLLVELGGNDGLRGFPVKKAKQNLLQIIQKARAQDVIPAIMQVRIPPNFGPRYTKMFEGIYPVIAKEQKIPLVPFFMDQIAIHPELIMADGLHPNVKAMPQITDIMEKEILKLVENADAG